MVLPQSSWASPKEQYYEQLQDSCSATGSTAQERAARRAEEIQSLKDGMDSKNRCQIFGAFGLEAVGSMNFNFGGGDGGGGGGGVGGVLPVVCSKESPAGFLWCMLLEC